MEDNIFSIIDKYFKANKSVYGLFDKLDNGNLLFQSENYDEIIGVAKYHLQQNPSTQIWLRYFKITDNMAKCTEYLNTKLGY